MSGVLGTRRNATLVDLCRLAARSSELLYQISLNYKYNLFIIYLQSPEIITQ